MDLTPTSIDALSRTLAEASAQRRSLAPVGGGTHSRRGASGRDAEPLSIAVLDAVVDHAPADLTITVPAGMLVHDLARRVADAGQEWPQAEMRADSTVGGVLAAGANGRRRLGSGAIRDSLLQVVFVTGDGRVVTGGARTVKAVTGYDLPRLVVGSMGTLGVIAQVTLKLWPMPQARETSSFEGPIHERIELAERILATVHRPSSILLSPGALHVETAGTPSDTAPPEGTTSSGAAPEPVGRGLVEIGVPPRRVADLARALEAEGRAYLAEVGVGRCTAAVESIDDVLALRRLAHSGGGHCIVADGPDDLRADPELAWGPAPEGHAIMRRLKSVFDPAGILNPGRYVDGI